MRKRSTGWCVEVEGVGRAHSRFATQAAAWEAGKALARRKGHEAVLHARDGRVRSVYEAVHRRR